MNESANAVEEKAIYNLLNSIGDNLNRLNDSDFRNRRSISRIINPKPDKSDVKDPVKKAEPITLMERLNAISEYSQFLAHRQDETATELDSLV